MSDLHHLDAAETFSGQQAAALVVGIDSLDPQAALWKAGPVLEQMKEGHRIGRVFATQVMTPAEFETQRKHRIWADALVSVLFDSYPLLQKNPWPSDPNRPYELPARFAGPDGEFQLQKFARAEIQRWLSVVGIRSVYQFDRKQLDAIPFQATPATAIMAETTFAGASGGVKPDKVETDWILKPTVERTPGYRWVVHKALKAAKIAGQPCPKAQHLLDEWKLKPPIGMTVIQSPGRNELEYELETGKKKRATVKQIQAVIKGLLSK